MITLTKNRESKKKKPTIFEAVVMKNFLKLISDIKTQVQEMLQNAK